jgi:hypothetical protein
VSTSPVASRDPWQDRLRALERLDLGLLVDGEHDGVRRRGDVQADDVTDLVDQLRIGRQLERLGAVGLQAEVRQMRPIIV